MKGSLRQLCKDRWQLRVYLGVDPGTGKKRQLGRVHRGGKRSAEDALRDLLAEVKAGREQPTRRVTVEQLLELHLAERWDGWAHNTRHEARRLVDAEIVPVLGQRDIRQVRPLDVEHMVKAIAATQPRTAVNTLARLRAAYSDALRWELADENPAQIAKAPSVPQRDDTTPTVGDITPAILAAVAADDLPLAVLVRVAVVTGCRRGELAALRWSDLDLDAGMVEVSRAITIDRAGRAAQPGSASKAVVVEGPAKTHNRKRLSLDAGTVSWFRALQTEAMEHAKEFGIEWNPNGFVWSQRPDGLDPWWPDTITSKWRKLAKEIGRAEVRFHDLRHAMVVRRVPSSRHRVVLSCHRHTDGGDQTAQHLDHYRGLTSPKRRTFEGPPPQLAAVSMDTNRPL